MSFQGIFGIGVWFSPGSYCNCWACSHPYRLIATPFLGSPKSYRSCHPCSASIEAVQGTEQIPPTIFQGKSQGFVQFHCRHTTPSWSKHSYLRHLWLILSSDRESQSSATFDQKIHSSCYDVRSLLMSNSIAGVNVEKRSVAMRPLSIDHVPDKCIST